MPEEDNSQILPPAGAPTQATDAVLEPAEPLAPGSAPAEAVPEEPAPPIPSSVATPASSAPLPLPQAFEATSPAVQTAPASLSHLFTKLKEKLFGRTEKRLNKILDYARKKGSITNDQVQMLVYVSDATATRYLSKLAKQAKLMPVGKTKARKYTPL
ncbi:MAG: hypothetical protein AAB410_03425 [Patescibacteria group bacterium]